ncbi:hypothetical protein [Gynuella sp.]|uniref:hypothetical protein n=1 Tax=Gynuella sp. TaxID=2969146 RepID=UPI003D11F352
MKKVITTFALTSLSAFGMTANLGENFEPGGFALQGSVNIESNDNDSVFYADPGVLFNLSHELGISGGAILESHDDWTKVGVQGGAVYRLPYNHAAVSGLVHEVGADASLYNISPDQGDSKSYLTITPYYQGNYYITPRVAVYGKVRALDINVFGDDVDTIDTYLAVSVGIRYSLAFRDMNWAPFFAQ